MKIYEVNDRESMENLKGQEGDLCIVNEGFAPFNRTYVWQYGNWVHNEGYVNPLREPKFPSTPSV